MPIKRGKIIRPLFDLSKSQIIDYLDRHKIGYQVDQTNLKSDVSRNYIRNRLLPELRKRLNPQVDRALINLAETVADEEAELDRKADKAIQRTVTLTPGGKIELVRSKVRGYTEWVRRRLLKRCLESISDGLSVDRETVERLDRLIIKGGSDTSLPGKIQVRFIGATVILVPGKPILVERELILGQAVSLNCPAARVSARLRSRVSGAARKRQAKRVELDAAKLSLPLTVRTVKPGDRFQPLGMNGRKKVGDFLTDRKVPKVISPSDPSSAWNAKANKRVQFGYGLNYLIDIEHAVIVDVEATPARTYDEVAATRTMIERTEACFDLKPKRLAADTAYGSGAFLGWLVKENRITPHIPVWDRASATTVPSRDRTSASTRHTTSTPARPAKR